jgi:hypothetical protein
MSDFSLLHNTQIYSRDDPAPYMYTMGTGVLSRKEKRQGRETDQVKIVLRLRIQNSVRTLIPPAPVSDNLVITGVIPGISVSVGYCDSLGLLMGARGSVIG